MANSHWKGYYKLQEEMGELNQAMGKLGAFPEGKYWDGTDLVENLKEELVDVMATIIYFSRANALKLDQERLQYKLNKFNEYNLSSVVSNPKDKEK